MNYDFRMRRLIENRFSLLGVVLILSTLAALLVFQCPRAHDGLSSQFRAADPGAAPTDNRPPTLLPGQLQESLLSNSAEDPYARSDWFLFQRAYPNDSLPAHARRAAWEARPSLDTGEQLPVENVWQEMGPAPTESAFMSSWGLTSGRVNAIAVSPANPEIILAGSSTGGIWRSSDGGNRFKPVSDDQTDLAVGSIVFSKSNPDIVYAGMGDTKLGYLGSGVLRSTDAGRSWVRVSNDSLPPLGTVSKLEADPAIPQRVYVAQYSRLSLDRVLSSGFFVSTDGGANWTRTMAGLPRDFVIDGNDRRTLYLGVSRVDEAGNWPAGLYKSTDAGVTWTPLFETPYDRGRTRDVRVALSAGNPNSLYVYTGGFIGNSFDVRVFYSGDGGLSWTDRGSQGLDPFQFGYNTYLFADPVAPHTVYVGSRDLYRSTDSGVSWSNLTRNFVPFGSLFKYTPGVANTHPDQHAFAISPGNPAVILLGNDGGVSKSTDGGRTFRSLNSTLSLTQFVSLAMHPTDSSISYAGSQDNGTQRRRSPTSRWQEFIPGDGGNCVIDPLDPSRLFTTYVRGIIFRFSDDGNVFERQVAGNPTFGEPDEGGRISFYAPFTGNGADSTLYFGTWRLFSSTDLGETWTTRSGDLDLTRGITETGSDVLTAIGVGASNTSVIYTGSARGRAMVSIDGGFTWRDISSGLPNRFITRVTVDAANSSCAYLSVSGFGSGHVFKTVDAGNTWIDISGNLPDIPVNSLLIDPLQPNALYAGTDIGVFRSPSGGYVWESFNRGMPPVVVKAFSAQSTGLIQAATYGRGVYQFRTNAPSTPPPLITSAVFDKGKRLTLSGEGFGSHPSVFINSVNRSSRIRKVSDGLIRLKGTPQKLGLKTGNNIVVVITSNGLGSNASVLRVE